MLQVVLSPAPGSLIVLPTTTQAGIDGLSAKLRSTLHGTKKITVPAPRMIMLESVSQRQQVLGDLEASYAYDVLELVDKEGEDAVDSKLRLEAKNLGIDGHTHGLLSSDAAKARSMNTLASEGARRSESIGSRASHSTGLTSNFSDMSRDHHNASLRGGPRASLSFRDYDAFLARGKLNGGRSSLSFSPPLTPAQSTLSLSLSSPDESPKKHFRRLRGLSMLRLHRTSSSTSLSDSCPHCPHDAFSQRRAIHKLPCGHKLCTPALRSTINTGIAQGPTGAVPCCCGTPIPGYLVEQVMTRQEQQALLDRLEQWDEAASITTSTQSEPRDSLHHRPGALTEHSRTASDESKVDSHTSRSRRDLDKAVETPEYKLLRHQQEEQRDRFHKWAEQIRLAFETQHALLRKTLCDRHEKALDDLSEQQATTLVDAEDKQVKAEADMREAHSNEKRINATALKHMEAYCAGIYSSGQPHSRTVTDQDKAELEKARRMRDGMDAKHASAINVLRGEQSRRMTTRVQRQEKEVSDVEKIHTKEEAELEKGCLAEVDKFREMENEKRRRLVARWEAQNAIFFRRWESETGITLNGRLPGVEMSKADEQRHQYALPGARRPRFDSRLAEE